MIPRAPPEYEDVLLRISPDCFTKKISARELELDHLQMTMMLELGCCWKFVGWALSADVFNREFMDYVILLERDGNRSWLHCSRGSFMNLVELVQQDPALAIPLR